MKLANLSILNKIAAAFGILLLLVAGLGITAIDRMSAINENALDVRNNWLPSSIGMADMESAVQSYRLTVVNQMFNPAEHDNGEKIAAARGRVQNSRAAYTPLITAGTDDVMYVATFDKQWPVLDESTTKVMALLATDPTAAREMLYGPNRHAFSDLLATIGGDIKFNSDEGRKAADRGAEIYSSTRMVIIAVLIVGLVLAALLGAVLVRAIATPVRAMTDTMKRLADGDLAVEIPDHHRADEIGRMAATLLVFRDNAQAARDLRDEAERVRVLKDRRQAAMDRHTNDFGTTIAGVMESLTGAAAELRDTANSMAEQVSHIRDSATGTADGAAVASQTMASVAAGAEQMSASISEISKQVAHVTTAVRTAMDRAATTDAKVAGMAEAAERVGHVVQLITNIAGQTNLLALNATIEAARAGEAGKGFAVVAGEVKALAAQTAKATDEIGAQIGAIRATTEEAVGAMREVTNAIGQVEQVATAIAAAVEEQAAATREIASSVQTVTLGAEQTAQSMHDVSGTAVQADGSSKHVLKASEQLGETARTLQGEVDQFLRAMADDHEEDRRRYERIPGNGAKAKLVVAGQPETDAVIENISRGGVALLTPVTASAGSEIQVTLPDAGGPVMARVVRAADGRLALCFRQDTATLGRVDRTLDRIGGGRAKAA
ncbi:MAG: methyl-accepting chemotaxis protein [Acetobacteraceae bacterium]|nr:methyl-accepting chemotaxis protein [Acetobacteraceae bacterium]